MIYPKWTNTALYVSFGLYFLDFLHLGSMFWKVGAIVSVLATARIGYWCLFQRPRMKFLGYGPVAVPGTGFIFQPPAGWTVEEVSGNPIPYCFGTAIGGFRPNLNFVLDSMPGSLEDSLANAKAASAAHISKWRSLLIVSGNEGIYLENELLHRPKTHSPQCFSREYAKPDPHLI